MLGAVLTGVEEMHLRQVPTPRPGPGEVRVRVKACGVCQTDYTGYLGKREQIPYPTILGHEIAGVIDEVGEGTGEWQVGDEVALSPVIPCGRCHYCRIDKANHCRSGIVIGGEGQPTIIDGAFAEYVVVPTIVLYRKPSSVSFEAACLAEPLAGSYKGLIDFSGLRIGDDVAIIGCGGMGLLILMIAAAAGAGRIVALDISDFRLDFARRLGAHLAVNCAKEDAADAVRRFLPRGPNIVMEAAGTLEAASLAFDLTTRMTRVNMFGVIVPGDIPVSPARIHFTETAMDSSFSVTPRVMVKSLELMEKGLVDPGRIVTHRVPLSRIDEAMGLMTSPDRVKVVVVPDDEM